MNCNMSHVVKVKVAFKDLDALESAGRHLGMTLNRGKKSYNWYGCYVGDSPLPEGFKASQLGHCDHALSIDGKPGAYEVGIVEQQDGSYTLLYDFWAGGHGLLGVIGRDAKNLTDEYALAVAERAATEQGWMYERTGGELIIYVPGEGELHVTKDTVDAVNFSGTGCAAATRTIAEAMGAEMSSTVKPEYSQVTAESRLA